MIIDYIYSGSLNLIDKVLTPLKKIGFEPVPELDLRKKYYGNKKKFWVHAASVGEVRGIYSLVSRLITESGDSNIIVTTTSVTGLSEAKRLLPSVEVRLAPVDLPKYINNFLSAYEPEVLIINETEIWPNLINLSKSRGIKCINVNARISDSSFWFYNTFGFYFKNILNKFDRVFVQTEIDKERYLRIGVDESRVELSGSTKYDFPINNDSTEYDSWLNQLKEQKQFCHIIVFGSVREEEEEEIAQAVSLLMKKHSDYIFIIVPRHPERFSKIEQVLNKYHIKFGRRSSCDFEHQTYVLDKMGELLSAYKSSEICFVGGTFSHVGGHNILEPAYFSKPIFTGENLQNVRDVAKVLMYEGALVKVKNGQELGERISMLIKSNQNEIAKMSVASISAYTKLKGATDKIFEKFKIMQILLICLFLLNSCSPTKGYVGPDLPETELAIVYFDDCNSGLNKVRANSEGIEFDSNGISLLPGKHNFDSFIEYPQRPYDCIPQTNFDQSGYDSCLRRRQEALSKPNSKYVPTCYISDYQKTVYLCLQSFRQYVCALSESLSKGQKYDLCAYQIQGFVRLKLSTHSQSQTLKENDCTYTSEETRRLEFSNAY